MNIGLFSLEENHPALEKTRCFIVFTEFLSRRAFSGIYFGGCLTLNVDHFYVHHSPIGARAGVTVVQLIDTDDLQGRAVGRIWIPRSERWT